MVGAAGLQTDTGSEVLVRKGFLKVLGSRLKVTVPIPLWSQEHEGTVSKVVVTKHSSPSALLQKTFCQ